MPDNSGSSIEIWIAGSSLILSLFAIWHGVTIQRKSNKRDDFTASVRTEVDQLRYQIEELSDEFTELALYLGPPDDQDFEAAYRRYIRVQRKVNRKINDLANLPITDTSVWLAFDDSDLERGLMTASVAVTSTEKSEKIRLCTNVAGLLENCSKRLSQTLNEERKNFY